jgi:hypothetical protein
MQPSPRSNRDNTPRHGPFVAPDTFPGEQQLSIKRDDPGPLLAMFTALDGAPEHLVRAEIITWRPYIEGIIFGSYDAEDLCRRSHVFRDLVRQHVESKKVGGKEELISLTRLWKVAGCPEDKSPPEYTTKTFATQHEAFNSFCDRAHEDRGEAGIWSDWETAAWYVTELDPRVEGHELAAVIYT